MAGRIWYTKMTPTPATLARSIHEHAGEFEAADAALKQALAVTHFRDARHAEVLERRVRLHERFDRLPALRAELEARLEAEPGAREEVLRSLAEVARWTVDRSQSTTVSR